MKRIERWGLAGAMVAATVFSAAESAACGACLCFEPPATIPTYARLLLPTNGRLFVTPRVRENSGFRALDPSSIQLREVTSDREVATDQEPVGSSLGQFWLVPRAALEAQVEYTVVSTDPEVTEPLFTFRTSDEEDVTAPELGDIEFEAQGSAAACGAHAGATATISFVSDAQANGYLGVLEVEVTGAAGVERLFMPTAFGAEPQQYVIGTPTDGDPDCLGSQLLKQGELGERYGAVFTVYDWAGNPKKSAALEFELGMTATGGCGEPVPPPGGSGGMSHTAAGAGGAAGEGGDGPALGDAGGGASSARGGAVGMGVAGARADANEGDGANQDANEDDGANQSEGCAVSAPERPRAGATLSAFALAALYVAARRRRR